MARVKITAEKFKSFKTKVAAMFGLSKKTETTISNQDIERISAMAEAPAIGWRDPEAVENAKKGALAGAIDFLDYSKIISEQIKASFSADKREKLHASLGRSNGNAGPAFGSPCLLYTSPSPRDKRQSRMPSSA